MCGAARSRPVDAHQARCVVVWPRRRRDVDGHQLAAPRVAYDSFIANASLDGGPMTLATAVTEIDVRMLAPRERPAAIFSTFRDLAPGRAIELVNDHDPTPLHAQFAAELPGRFLWDAIEDGPDVWRVRIVKRARAGGECCGCGCSRD
jgi:uncharacterized protein (DUF2249 family)